MATGAFTLNNKMQTNLASGLLDFSTGTWKAILLTSTAPVATAETFADVSSHQPSNAGYAEASVSCTVTGSGSNLVAFGDASFTASGGSYTARYIAYYETGASLLAGYMLLDEDAVDITINNGETVTISAPNAIIIGTTNVLEVNGQNGVVELDGTNLYEDDNASPLVTIKSSLDSKYSATNPPPYPAKSNRNLLDNPFFTVNQRGASSYSGLIYGVDRFKNGNANTLQTVNSDNTITLTKVSTGNMMLIQYMEDNFAQSLAGKTVCLSINVASTSGLATNFRLRYGDATDTYLGQLLYSGLTTGINSITGTVPATTKKIRLEIFESTNTDSTASITIESIKLELGNISTLANDTVPNYAEELAKCQRFFCRLKQQSWPYGAYGLGYGAVAGTGARFFLSIPTMRKNPTISFSGTINAWLIDPVNGTVASVATATNMSCVGNEGHNMYLNVTFASGIVLGGIYMLRAINSASHIDLNADL